MVQDSVRNIILNSQPFRKEALVLLIVAMEMILLNGMICNLNVYIIHRCLEFLLQKDANPSIQDKEGYNTVHYAAAYGHRQCLELVSQLNQC